MDLAAIGHGMTVADIGAGRGLLHRAAGRAGSARKGRVLAQDIDAAGTGARWGRRVERERLDNVSIKPGAGG